MTSYTEQLLVTPEIVDRILEAEGFDHDEYDHVPFDNEQESKENKGADIGD